MATGNTTFGGTDRPDVSKSGVRSYLQQQNERANLSESFWNKESGYLSNSIKQLEEMKKYYSEINVLIEKSGKLSKQDIRDIEGKKKKLNEQLAILKEVQKNNTVDSKQALSLINQANKLRQKGLDDYKDAIEKVYGTESEAARQVLKNYIEAANEMDEINKKLENTNYILKNTSADLSGSLSESLKSAGDTLSKLTNMFNLEKMANNAMEQSARSKLEIMNSINKQFGFSNAGQFDAFKDSLNNTLKDMNTSMGNLFNATDMRQYMQNISSYGITNATLAEQQMRSTMISTKYLGTTDETMSQIYKFMKNTNSYDMLDKHNQTIVGLLKSQLGLSADQLDALSTIAYSANESKMAIGMSADAITASDQAALAYAAAAESSGLSQEQAGSLADFYNRFITADIKSLSGYATLGVANPYELQQMARGATTTEAQVEIMSSLLSQIQGGAALTTGGTTSQILQDLGGLDPGTTAAIMSINQSELAKNLTEAIENIKNTTSEDVSTYVEQSVEATWLEKIQNQLSVLTNGIDWKYHITLANAAFILMASASVLDSIKTIRELGPQIKSAAGGIKSLSSVNTGLLATGGGILLGVGAANVITSAIDSGFEKSKAAEISAASKSLEGTSLQGNKAAATSAGIANAVTGDSLGSSLWTGGKAAFSSATHLLGIGTLGWTRDLASINRDDWKLMQNALAQTKWSADDKQRYLIAWLLLLMSAGRQSDIPDLSGISKEDITALMKSKGWSKSLMDTTVNAFPGTFTYPNRATNENQSFINWSSLNLEGYHKAGKNYIPKDNYHALLHKGEMVLNAKQAKAYRNGYGFGGGVADVGPHHSGYAGHSGIDLYFGTEGTPVGSAIAGKVIGSYDIPANYNDGKKYHSGGYSSYGRVVKVLGTDGNTYIYGHLSQRAVSEGQMVNAGDLLGYSGNTGNSSGPHLHFEVAGKGKGEAVHAAYYTPFVRNVTGAASGEFSSDASPMDVSEIDSSASSGKTYMPISAKRTIPGSVNSGGSGGANDITGSFDSNTDKIIRFLSGLQKDQDVDREVLMRYSRANVKSYLNR